MVLTEKHRKQHFMELFAGDNKQIEKIVIETTKEDRITIGEVEQQIRKLEHGKAAARILQ